MPISPEQFLKSKYISSASTRVFQRTLRDWRQTAPILIFPKTESLPSERGGVEALIKRHVNAAK